MTSTQMSHSTTATSTYILQKYSKSYPQNPGQPDGGDAGAEWQHFTNPVIRLVLDIKKASSNELESVRVRILWAMNNGNDQYPNEVVFVSLSTQNSTSPGLNNVCRKTWTSWRFPLRHCSNHKRNTLKAFP